MTLTDAAGCALLSAENIEDIELGSQDILVHDLLGWD